MADDPTSVRYKLRRLSDYTVIPASEHLIEPYLPLGAQILLAAMPKAFKTYLALTWACCIATGTWFLGRRVKKGRVLYIALESYHGVLRRKEAWRKRHKKTRADLDDLVCVTTPVNFSVEENVTKILRDLDAQGFRPDFIVIDTWFKSTAGAKVSDQADMTDALDRLTFFQKAVEAMPALKEALPQVTILIIAHTDKKGLDLFGSIAQFANCDVLYMLKRKAHESKVTLTCTGARDIEEPPDLIMGLEKEIIETAKGQEENLVIAKELSVLDERSADIKGKRKAGACTANARLAFDILIKRFPQGAERFEWLEAWQAEKGGPQARGASDDSFDKAKQELLDLEWIEAFGLRRGTVFRVKGSREDTTETAWGDDPDSNPRSAPPKGDADYTRNRSSASNPQNGLNADNASEGCGSGSTTESNNGIPPEMDPDDLDSAFDDAAESLKPQDRASGSRQ
jgi:hypothetical protein